MPFVVSCCHLLKAIILKTFNVLAIFASWMYGKYTLCNLHFTGNLFFGFGRYYGKVVPEPAVSHLSEHLHWQRMSFKQFYHIDTY